MPTATRDHALDAWRTLAILGMMASHTARLMPRDVRPDWATFVLLIEPIIPSLFLLLVGLSLSHSFAAALSRGVSASTWYARQLKRAGALWLVSAVFFSLEMGVRLPDLFLAGGILATIAYAIVLVGGLLTLGEVLGGPSHFDRLSAAPRPSPEGRGSSLSHGLLVGLGLVTGSVLFVWLDVTGQRVHPVNIGNSPFLPLWLFALAGATWGTLLGKPAGAASPGRIRTTIALALGALGALSAVWLIVQYGLEPLFTKPFGRSDATRLIPGSLFGGAPLSIGYYNLRPVLAAACFGLHVAGLIVWGRAFKTLGARSAAVVFALGRQALLAYILHLALLAILVTALGDRQPLKSGMMGTLTLLGLILICQVATFLRRSNKNVQLRH